MGQVSKVQTGSLYSLGDRTFYKDERVHPVIELGILFLFMTKSVLRPYRTAPVGRIDAQTQAFHTKLAISLALVSVALLAVLSLVYGPGNVSTSTAVGSHNWYTARVLQQNTDDATPTDYTSYSCHYIFDVTTEPGADRCQFARECNLGDGLWAPFVFCGTSSSFSATTWTAILSPFLLFWMVLLFRMLGSTAEEFFSPALEMFSFKLGLPPRFAGVSLLALGNGAADVSATVAAITTDPVNGYQLSLGALTGAAMVIGSVVSALVVLVAGGVPCRGALVRDVAALLVAIAVVWYRLASGTMGPDSITIFLTLYFVFVVLVLAADVYHRAVVLPRRSRQADDRERERELAERRRVEADGPAVPGANPAVGPSLSSNTPSHGLDQFLTALSNYDNDPRTTGWGVESEDLADDRPVRLHGSQGILHGHAPTPERLDSTTEGGIAHHYNMLEDAVDRTCVEDGSPGFSASNWSGALQDGYSELRKHAEQTWEDIVYNADVGLVSKILLIAEFPFTVLRKATVAIPCEGYYVRALVALSLALSPVWLAFYMYRSHDTNVLGTAFGIFWGIMVLAALLVLRYAPGGQGNMALSVATPIALYGFVVGATWIDTIADMLVSLLDFIGIVLRIPGPIVGLTILAWGNSMGDLSANVTMARKGLANMAMTACFAGPFFNILMGLGLGFGRLAAQTGQSEFQVSLSPSVVTGFLFIVLNSVTIIATGLFVGEIGTIPKNYGYIALTLYTVYLVTSISLQYSKYGQEKEV